MSIDFTHIYHKLYPITDRYKRFIDKGLPTKSLIKSFLFVIITDGSYQPKVESPTNPNANGSHYLPIESLTK